MTDETKPKRMRGQKEREAAYRAGFLDGLLHATQELAEKRDIDAKRDGAVAIGLRRHLIAEQVAPKRTRRRRGNGADPATRHVPEPLTGGQDG